jgi:hypothetical protein
MSKFTGFRRQSPSIAVPDAFIAQVLPAMDDPAEIKVVLACFRILSLKSGSPRAVTWDDLMGDDSLRAASLDEQAVAEALDRAVERGVLLRAYGDPHGDVVGMVELFFANTESGRAAVKLLADGDWPAGLKLDGKRNGPGRDIFALYE